MVPLLFLFLFDLLGCWVALIAVVADCYSWNVDLVLLIAVVGYRCC